MSYFSEMLRGLRKDNGITQAQLAKEIGVSKSSINMYERGEREPSYKTLEKISQYFNISIDLLLGNDAGIKSIMSAGERMNKSFREIAFKHHFIDSYGYENFSDIGIYNILVDTLESKNIDDALRLELSMEFMLATMEFSDVVLREKQAMEDGKKELIAAIKKIQETGQEKSDSESKK